MVVAVTISQRGSDLEKLFKILPVKLATTLDQATFDYAKIVAGAMKKEVLIDPKRPITTDRANAARFIKAKKKSKFRSQVVLPRSLFFLDTMMPHYVSLKRGRNISKWAKKNFGNASITNRSRVSRGPRGGLRGVLWVTPHRFTAKALRKVRARLAPELKKGVRKAIRSSRRNKNV